MAEIKDVNVSQESGEKMEYAFGSVPQNKRKKMITILMILAGYTISLSNFVTGATVGSKMTFEGAFSSIFFGNAVLAVVATGLGIISCKTGLTTSVLAHKSLGKRSSAILSLLLAISAVNWIAVNANTFGNLLITNVGWWKIPLWVTVIITVVLWAQSAIRGSKGLVFVSYLGVPAAIVLTIACFASIGKVVGFDTVTSYVPAESITFAQGSTSIVGAWIFGCIVTPDVCRYAKKPKHVAIGAPIAVYVGLFALEMIGAMTAQATGEGGFVAATAALGLGVLVLVCAIFCVWTTQDNNIYSASLALQNVIKDTKAEGKIKHSTFAWIIAIAAGICAAIGITKWLLPIVQTLSVLLPPVPGFMLAEFLVIRKSKEGKTINPIALITWAVSTAVGEICIIHSFFIPALVSMILSFVLYIILSKLLDGKINKIK